MSFKELLDHTQLLVSSLIVYCHENQGDQKLIYGTNREPMPKKAINEPAAPPLPTPSPPVLQKKPAPVVPKKEAQLIVENPKELPPVCSHSSPIQTLSTALTKPQQPHFGDILEKIKQLQGPSLHSDPVSDSAVDEALAWKKDYPSFALISFFAKGSPEELFLQKVAQAIASRLFMPSIFFTSPSLQIAADLTCFSSSGALKAAVFAYDAHQMPKAVDFLANFPSLEQVAEQEKSPLFLKKKLFSTPFYQLALPPHIEQSLDFKTALWKALQHILVS